jgi:hypothetical protein
LLTYITHLDSRLEEVNKELDRIKRARSFQEDDSTSPASFSLADPLRATSSLAQNDGVVSQVEVANPFGLNDFDNKFSPVSVQSLEDYKLNTRQISGLFKEYERSTWSSGPGS